MKIVVTAIIFAFVMPQISMLHAAPPKIKTSVFFKRQYINIANIANVYGFRFSVNGSRLLMSGKYHKFSFTSEKNNASFNGVKIILSHAVYKNKNAYYISKIDYDTILLPLINRRNLKKHKVKVVYLDPGHGGKDVGAEGRYYNEKMLTLRLASKVRALLKKNGFTVIMSRRADAYLTLQNRAAIANRHKADIFVSIHFNSAANKKVYGLETYCMTPVGASSSNGSKIEYKRYPGNSYDMNNFALAYLMQRSMLAYSKALDRGVKHARFLVLREVKMPAVLVECGFLSNPESERIIGTDKYLDQLAQGIVASIINYKRAAGLGL